MSCIASNKECRGGSWTTQRCYQASTGKLLVKWECILCHKAIFTHAFLMEPNLCTYGRKNMNCEVSCPYAEETRPCRIPIYMTLGEFIDSCRRYDYHFMALEIWKEGNNG